MKYLKACKKSKLYATGLPGRGTPGQGIIRPMTHDHSVRTEGSFCSETGHPDQAPIRLQVAPGQGIVRPMTHDHGVFRPRDHEHHRQAGHPDQALMTQESPIRPDQASQPYEH
jgi:hypothetical protein